MIKKYAYVMITDGVNKGMNGYVHSDVDSKGYCEVYFPSLETP